MLICAYFYACALVETNLRGVVLIFQRGEVTLCQSESIHQIVMSFSPPVVGCLLEKGLQKGRGVTGTPQPPGYNPEPIYVSYFRIDLSTLFGSL